jgi:1-acyl-sn-glycerol-3-phosphate acyltransferase
MTMLEVFYKHYFRVRCFGLENIPKQGPACSSATIPAASRPTAA